MKYLNTVLYLPILYLPFMYLPLKNDYLASKIFFKHFIRDDFCQFLLTISFID